MHKSRIGFFILMAFSCTLFLRLKAQDTLNSAGVEKKSYQLYLDKNWDELIVYGKKALAAGFDYFYLRMRIGIAYYENKNYRLAEVQFQKALGYNSTDETLLEYLYFCKIFSGKYEEARKFTKKFPAHLASYLKTDSLSGLGYFMAEGGVKISDSSSLFSNGNYGQAALSHYVARNFSLFHAATLFGQKLNEKDTYSQFQYYLKASIPLKNKWSISPAIHIIQKKQTLQLPKPPPPHFPPPPGSPPPPMPGDTTIKSVFYAAGISLSKSIKLFDLSAGFALYNIDDVSVLHHSLTLAYSPLGNEKINIGTTAYLHTSDSYKTSYISLFPYLNYRPLNKLGFNLSYLYNRGANITEMNAYLINNSLDLTTGRISLNTSFDLTKRFSIYFLYQYETKEEAKARFMYHYHLFVGGIRIVPK